MVIIVSDNDLVVKTLSLIANSTEKPTLSRWQRGGIAVCSHNVLPLAGGYLLVLSSLWQCSQCLSVNIKGAAQQALPLGN